MFLAFSKRFTSPVGSPFPALEVVEQSYPGRVGGIKAWTRLEMTLEEAKALLGYVSKKVSFTRCELVGEGIEVVGRNADDMTMAKGFNTPRPNLPDEGLGVPAITRDDVAWFLSQQVIKGDEENDLISALGLTKKEVEFQYRSLRPDRWGQTYEL